MSSPRCIGRLQPIVRSHGADYKQGSVANDEPEACLGFEATISNTCLDISVLYLVVYGLQLSIFAKYGQAGAGLVWLAAGGVGCEVRA